MRTHVLVWARLAVALPADSRMRGSRSLRDQYREEFGPRYAPPRFDGPRGYDGPQGDDDFED